MATLRFRADIEGLRAIAVGLVVFYHAGLSGFSGGYVGVDVFYVVSGFLITGLLLNELTERGQISLARFYGRRVRRLLPSSALVIAVVFVVSYLVVEPLRFSEIARDGLAAGTYTANFRFVEESTNYFLAQRAPSPFLHFWSLAVEEQFYLVWPALFLVSAGRNANRARIIGVLTALFIGSLMLSIQWTTSSPPRAFFLLPTRAWELAVGGMLALSVPALEQLPRRVGACLGVLGLGAVVASSAVFTDTTPFPGWRALVPVLGTAAVITGGTVGTSGVGALLERAPLQWLGRRSYVLYLWHWPLLVLGAAWLGHDLSLAEAMALCSAAVVLAALTHRILEDPIHHSAWLASAPRRSLVLGVILTVASAGTAGIALAAAPSTEGSAPSASRASAAASELEHILTSAARTNVVPNNLTPTLADAATDGTQSLHEGCHVLLEVLEPKRDCVYGSPQSETTVVLFGDSHADQWFPALHAAADRNQWRLVVVTKTACPAAELTVYSITLKRSYVECNTWRRNALTYIQGMSPALVVVANTNVYGLGDDDSHHGIDRAWKRGYAATLAALSRIGAATVVLAETPKPGSDVPVCVSEHIESVRDCVSSRADAVNEEFLDLERDAARRVGASFVNTTNWVCSRRVCPVVVDDLLVYHDTNHISSAYSKWLAPVLAHTLRGVLRTS